MFVNPVKNIVLFTSIAMLVGLYGCQTLNVGSSRSATMASSLTPGVRPIPRPIASDPHTAPDGTVPPSSPSVSLTDLIASGKLAQEYNGVLVAFLGQEARQWMSEAQRKQALDQAVTALKKKIDISRGEQIETGLGTVAGLAMQLAGGSVIGRAGASVAGDYYAEMNSWIDAAFDLAKLGYLEDAGRFFEHGMRHFPYDDHRGRCVAGYAMVHPEKAYAFLTEKLKGPSTEEIQAAIRMLGHLASAHELDSDTRARCLDTIADYATGMMNAVYFLDAIYALDVSNDIRAVPALKRFMKGIMVTDEQQRPALTSLALRYKDAEAITVLEDMLKAGTFSTYDWQDKQFAFGVLVRAGQDSGYDYARENLVKRAKGFMAASDQPDLKPDIIETLLIHGDLRGTEVMLAAFDRYDDDEWIKTWMATAMMLLGEGCAMDLAKSMIGTPSWEFTAVDIARGLAMYGDESGLEVLRGLMSLRQVPDGPGMQIMRALAGRNDVQAGRERLERLRSKIAYALGQMDLAACAPLLERLLADESDSVRRAAAHALVELSVPEAIPVIVKALDIRYGLIPGQNLDTTPLIHARLVRAAGNRWGGDAKAEAVLAKAAKSPHASVQLIANAMQR